MYNRHIYFLTKDAILVARFRQKQATNVNLKCSVRNRQKEMTDKTERQIKRKKGKSGKRERPASVSKGDWSGNSTRKGLVGLSFRFDFGHVVLPSQDWVHPLKKYHPEASLQEKTAPTCPNFCSEIQTKLIKFCI